MDSIHQGEPPYRELMCPMRPDSRHSRLWPYGLGLGLLLFLVAGVGGMAWMVRVTPSVLGLTLPRHPTTADLVEHYQANREPFEQLVKLARSESETLFIYRGTAERPNREPKERPYLVELDKLGAKGPVNVSVGRFLQVDILVSARGLGISGSTMGYVWSPDRARTPLVHDLQAGRNASDESSDVVFVALDNDWYLFYSWDR